ncbi:type I polyketide synthase, partial [Streptomyces parvulus]|uniref:type I polyketide synthase n=1 Tax=Streptomyces parvulus TaxID=146923 RepID=UPI0033B890EB
ASFAVMVGLAAVWSSVGVLPDAVLGHSQGEIAAACVSGALSLEDAARVVALRSQAIAGQLAGRGGMASVALSESEAAGRLKRWAGRVEVAAVNGPSSVVIAGDAEALDEALEVLAADGIRVRRVAVDYASHTRHVEDIRETLAETLAGVTAKAPMVPFYSTVTGEWVEAEGVLDGDYWYRNLRGQVGFGPAVGELVRQGHGVFVEVSAHPVLVQPITEILDGTDTTADDAVVAGSLRREDGGLRRLLTSMAELFVRGVPVDWSGVLPEGAASGRVDLPTYAFDHQHYWLETAGSVTDAASLGQAAADHPLLGAMVELPHSDGLVFTSRLSLKAQPWLADHRVGGVVLVPGTGLLELAVRAGDEAGCGVLEELVTEAPLVVPEHGGIRVQVAVDGPDETGSRTVEIYSRREDAPGDGAAWTRHATATLTIAPTAPQQGFDFTAWPPPGASVVEPAGLQAELAERGYEYGPAFQGVRAVWRRGDEVFAEVALPEEHREEAGRFGVHPALLEAVLNVPSVGAVAAEGDGVRQPLDWNGVVLHAVGASALRVRLLSAGPDTVALDAADETGGPVLSAQSLTLRALTAEQLARSADPSAAHSLYVLDWTQTPPAQDAAPEPTWVPVSTAEDVTVLAGTEGVPPVAVMEAVGGDGEDAALDLASRVLAVVQAWLITDGLAESRLVVATRGAVPAGDGVVTDPAGSAVWGLVRAAQAENPDRIVLVDADPASADAATAVVAALARVDEPQIAVRGTALFVPRLARATGDLLPDTPSEIGAHGTVLVTGGTGSLGALAARHLVTRYGVRHLILASRRGPDAEGAEELAAELTALGAAVEITACDVSDRGQAEALLAKVPEEHPLRGVVHTAGVLDAGVIGTVTPERLARVFAPKVDAVRHLDELTRSLALDVFVVYSSVSAVFMGAGSGSYAAANAYLDGLMANRRAAGLPGLSLAWGLWEQTDGMAANTDDLVRSRMNRRGGLQAMPLTEGMELFHSALRATQSLLVPAKLDLRGVRAEAAAGGEIPHMLRGLVRPGRQTARAASTQDGELLRRLAGLSAADREKALIDLVRAQAASVLGHDGPDGVRADTAFRETGFDSLTSVELRNRLRAATGLQLPATLVFDYPNPRALARHLHSELFPDGGTATKDVDEDRLRRVLASLPLDRFRAAGLMDALVKLAALDDGAPAVGVLDDADEERAVAELDVDDLVQLALGDN